MGSEYKDYYTILGVDRSATSAEIQRAYHKLALKTHPDIHPGDKESESRFKEANEAYEHLSDPAKRAACDKRNNRGETIIVTHMEDESAKIYSLLRRIAEAPFYQDDVFSIEALKSLWNDGAIADNEYWLLKRGVQERVFSLLSIEVENWNPKKNIGALENDIEQCYREHKITLQQRDVLAVIISNKCGF